jgi:hypothetical protein
VKFPHLSQLQKKVQNLPKQIFQAFLR